MAFEQTHNEVCTAEVPQLSPLLLWQPDKRLNSDAAKDGMGERSGAENRGWTASLGNIREVGQMIQYPKQIRAHIPLLHSAFLKV